MPDANRWLLYYIKTKHAYAIIIAVNPCKHIDNQPIYIILNIESYTHEVKCVHFPLKYLFTRSELSPG